MATQNKISTPLIPDGVEYFDVDPKWEGDTKYRQFFGRGENRYAVLPSYWAKTWGPVPLLGTVYADNEFLAERIAYDKGIISPHNCTFQAKIKLIGPVQSREIH